MSGSHESDLDVLRQISVLYVEDEAVTRRDLENLLRPMVSQVFTAENGQQGLFEFAKRRPDVVIADILMPVLDGIGFVGKIREMDPDAPVIVTTGAEDAKAMAKAINAGVGGYLLKPVDPPVLVRTLAAQGRAALARKELGRQRNLNILLRESIPFPVMILDVANRSIVTANAAARRFGFAEGQQLCGPMFPESALACMSDVAAYFEKGRDEVVPGGQRLALGRIFEVYHRPITADLAFFMAEDVTERRRLEQLREDVERISRHDLKSPLNVIINLPDMLLESHPAESAEADMLRMIRQAGEQMLHKINLSLDLYKMETGSYALVAVPVDIPEVLARAAAEQDILVRAKNLSMGIAVTGGAAGAGQGLTVAGDEISLQSMFSNLLRNAAEASPSGATVEIAVTPGDPLTVAVRNVGAVPAEMRDCFFEKYATAGKKGGTGLGTYSAWLITTAHGGKIGFSSSEAEGTTVWVKLPATRENRQT